MKTPLRPISHRLAFHPLESIRKIFRNGRMAAFCGQQLGDCPYPGNVGRTRSRGLARPEYATLCRQAWVAGFNAQKELMKSDAAAVVKAETDEATLWDQAAKIDGDW